MVAGKLAFRPKSARILWPPTRGSPNPNQSTSRAASVSRNSWRGRMAMAGDLKPWSAAIQRAVARACETGDEKKLDALADALVAAGLAGDVKAIKEIADRLDGKAPQPVHVAGEVTHNYVAFVPSEKMDLDEWQANFKPH